MAAGFGNSTASKTSPRRRPSRAIPTWSCASTTCAARRSRQGSPMRRISRSPGVDSLIDRPPCPQCGQRALRPDVVWFGEMPYEMDRIYAALRAADLLVSIGTSGAVYPAAGFVRDARELGARTLELNLERSLGSAWFDETRIGPATELVLAWVAEMLDG